VDLSTLKGNTHEFVVLRHGEPSSFFRKKTRQRPYCLETSSEVNTPLGLISFQSKIVPALAAVPAPVGI
jgi:hypothetical protein